MNEGIVTFDTQEKAFGKLVDVGCSVISSLSTDGKDLLYVGTDGNGVHFVSVTQRKVVKSFRHETGNDASIRSNSVYSLLVDRDGLLWIGFYQLGVDYTLHNNGLFAAYRYPPYLDTRDMPVRTIAFHQREKLVGSRDGLYFIDEDRRLFKSFHNLRANMIISSCYFEGKYYIGTYGGGMYVFDPLTLELVDFDAAEGEPFLTGHIFCIRPDADGDLWIGTSSGFTVIGQGSRWLIIPVPIPSCPKGISTRSFSTLPAKDGFVPRKGFAFGMLRRKASVRMSFPKDSSTKRK